MAAKPKYQNKTVPTSVSAEDFLASEGFTDAELAAGKTLIELFEKATQKSCVMWGKIFGFGLYHYVGKSSAGEWMATGFALRKNAITVYIMSGFNDGQVPLLKELGKHKLSGGSCLYIKKLEDIDLSVLENMIKTGLVELSKNHKVT